MRRTACPNCRNCCLWRAPELLTDRVVLSVARHNRSSTGSHSFTAGGGHLGKAHRGVAELEAIQRALRELGR